MLTSPASPILRHAPPLLRAPSFRHASSLQHVPSFRPGFSFQPERGQRPHRHAFSTCLHIFCKISCRTALFGRKLQKPPVGDKIPGMFCKHSFIPADLGIAHAIGVDHQGGIPFSVSKAGRFFPRDGKEGQPLSPLGTAPEAVSHMEKSAFSQRPQGIFIKGMTGRHENIRHHPMVLQHTLSMGDQFFLPLIGQPGEL